MYGWVWTKTWSNRRERAQPYQIIHKDIGYVIGVLELDSQRLLINATDSGLFVLDRLDMTIKPFGKDGVPATGLPTKKTQSMALGPNGTVFVGLYNRPGKISGLYEYDQATNSFGNPVQRGYGGSHTGYRNLRPLKAPVAMG